jgi:hypothetical protein
MMSSKSLSSEIGKAYFTQAQNVSEELQVKLKKSLKNCPECSIEGEPIAVYREVFVLLKCRGLTCEMEWLLCATCGEYQRKRITSTKEIAPHLRRDRERSKKAIDRNNHTRDYTLLPRNCIDEDAGMTMEDTDDRTTPEEDAVMSNQGPEGKIAPDTETVAEDMRSGIFDGRNENIDWLPCEADGSQLGFRSKSASQRYFQQCFISENAGAGMDYLVKRSHLNLRGNAVGYQEEGFQLPEGHAFLQMKIAQLAWMLSPKEKQILVAITHGCYKVGTEDGYDCCRTLVEQDLHNLRDSNTMHACYADAMRTKLSKPFTHDKVVKSAYLWSCRIPQSVNDLRNTYLEGANSILKNMPIPEIDKSLVGHSYVPITERIRDFLAHDQFQSMATIENDEWVFRREEVCHPSHSERAQEIARQLASEAGEDLARRAIKGYVFFWSDDVEPNRMAKAGRGSVWTLTMTIGTTKNNGHTFTNTYPIAFGRKGDNHSCVWEKIESDMQQLRGGTLCPFYVGPLKKKARVLFGAFAHLADQPERRGINQLRLGSGKFSARFGVSANHKDLYGALKACAVCSARNRLCLETRQYTIPIPTCPSCMNWDFLTTNSDVLGASPPPPNYPLLAENTGDHNTYRNSPFCRIVFLGNKQLIKPFATTYESLKGALDLAHECYCKHGWSSTNVEAYLRVEGINDEFIEIFMQYAQRCYSLSIAEANPGLYNNILMDKEKHPERYQRVPYPPPWQRIGLTLRDHPDVIMHLVYLGCVDTTMQLTQSWLKATKRNTAFISTCAEYLDPMIHMDIQWINILKYTGAGFGHWVSENYLGFARLMPWFYQNIAAVAPDVVVLPPESQQRTWLKQHNEYWLKCRGLPSDGNAPDLRKRVAEFLSAPNQPPIIREPNRPVGLVQDVITSLYHLLECIMTTKVTKDRVSETEYAVRCFLSAYDILHASVADDKGTPDSAGVSYIFGVYNLACLINLPGAMKRFGPLRHLWEGSTRGEGYLRFVKPMMTQGFKQINWHHHLHKNLLTAKAFESILPSEKVERFPPSSPLALKSRKSLVHKYRSQFELQVDMETMRLRKKKPVNVVLAKQKNGNVRIFAVVESYERVVELALGTATPPRPKFGFYYYQFLPANHYDVLAWASVCMTVHEIGYCMLLPLLEDPSQHCNNHMFALISSNWKTLGPTTPIDALIDMESGTFS